MDNRLFITQNLIVIQSIMNWITVLNVYYEKFKCIYAKYKSFSARDYK